MLKQDFLVNDRSVSPPEITYYTGFRAPGSHRPIEEFCDGFGEPHYGCAKRGEMVPPRSSLHARREADPIPTVCLTVLRGRRLTRRRTFDSPRSVLIAGLASRVLYEGQRLIPRRSDSACRSHRLRTSPDPELLRGLPFLGEWSTFQ